MDNERLNEQATTSAAEKNIETAERTKLPKQAFDSEYMTEFLREVRFLTEKGIKYTFVRKTPDYGVSQFKYRKTPALFAALVEFYSIIEAERLVRRRQISAAGNIEKEADAPAELTAEEIKKAQEILERAAAAIKTEETDDTL